MRSLSSALVNAARSQNRLPLSKVFIERDQLEFSLLHTCVWPSANEIIQRHAVFLGSDGEDNDIIFRAVPIITGTADPNSNANTHEIWLNRVTNHNTEAQWDSWIKILASSDDAVTDDPSCVALAQSGATIRCFYQSRNDSKIAYIESSDYGQTWGTHAHVGNETSVTGVAIKAVSTTELFYGSLVSHVPFPTYSMNVYHVTYSGGAWSSPVLSPLYSFESGLNTNQYFDVVALDSRTRVGIMLADTQSSVAGPFTSFVHKDGHFSQIYPIWLPLDNAPEDWSITGYRLSVINSTIFLVCYLSVAGSDSYQPQNFIAYLTSPDGIHWSKPEIVTTASDVEVPEVGPLLLAATDKVFCPGLTKIWRAEATSFVGVTNSAIRAEISDDVSEWSVNYPANSASQGHTSINNEAGQYNNHAILKKGSKLTRQVGYRTSAGDELVNLASESIDAIETQTRPDSQAIEVISRDYLKKLQTFRAPLAFDYQSQQRFYDDFTTGMGKWLTQVGTWATVTASGVMQASDHAGLNVVFASLNKAKNLMASVKITNGAIGGWHGLMVRASDKDNGYLVGLSTANNKVEIIRRRNGNNAVLASSSALSPTWSADASRWVMVKIQFNNIWAYTSTDGITWTLACSYTDTTIYFRSQPGYVGLFSQTTIPNSTLIGSHDAEVTVISVNDQSGFPSSGTLLIDDEQITYISKADGTTGQCSGDSGTGGTDGTNISVVDHSKSWSTSQWVGWTCMIKDGPDAGVRRTINGSGSDSFTIDGYFSTDTDNHGYSINLNEGSKLYDSAKSWTADQWVNFMVKLTGGSGSGQTSKIRANGATDLMLSGYFSPVPDDTTQFQIADALKGATRGTSGTTAVSHSDGAKVYQYIGAVAQFASFLATDMESEKTIEWIARDIAVRCGLSDIVVDYDFQDSFDTVLDTTKWVSAGATGNWSTSGGELIVGGPPWSYVGILSTYQTQDALITLDVNTNPTKTMTPGAILRASSTDYPTCDGYLVYVDIIEVIGATLTIKKKTGASTTTLLSLPLTQAWSSTQQSSVRMDVSLQGGFIGVWLNDVFQGSVHDTTYSDPGYIGLAGKLDQSDTVVGPRFRSVQVSELDEVTETFLWDINQSGEQALRNLIGYRRIRTMINSDDKLVLKYFKNRSVTYAYEDQLIEATKNLSDREWNNWVRVVGAEDWADYVDIADATLNGLRFIQVDNPDLLKKENCYGEAQLIVKDGKEMSDQRDFTGAVNPAQEREDRISIVNTKDGTDGDYIINDIDFTFRQGESPLFDMRIGTRLFVS